MYTNAIFYCIILAAILAYLIFYIIYFSKEGREYFYSPGTMKLDSNTIEQCKNCEGLDKCLVELNNIKGEKDHCNWRIS